MSATPWANGPLALISTPVFITGKRDMFTLGASDMAQMHNAVFRGYNSIYIQAPHVDEADARDFIGYCLTWYKLVDTHAHDEETGLFPMVEEFLGDKVFASTHEEHDAFLPALGNFQQYLTSLESPSHFESAKLLDIMNSFQGPFESHFRSEISTIAALSGHAGAPKEGTPEQVEAAAVFDRWGRNSLFKAGVADVVPFLLLNTDSTYENGTWAKWPPIPTVVRWGLTKVAGGLHRGQWKFASCDHSGRPKRLHSLGDANYNESAKPDL